MDGACCQGEVPQERPMVEDYTKSPEKPRKGEMLGQWEIRIKFLSLGCTISVGCKTFAFSSVEEGMEALNTYVENPVEEYEKWINKTN